MSEKVKCPNPECKAGLVLEMEQGMAFTRIKCPVCHGTGFAPTGEGLLTDEQRLAEYQKFCAAGLSGEYELTNWLLKAQAALTAGQMIELCKDAEILSSPNFKKKHPDYTYPFLTIHNFIKYLESRYGGG